MANRMTPAERLERWTTATAEGVISDLASIAAGRNAALRDASVRLGALVRGGLIERSDVELRLLDACEANGYLRRDGERTARGVIRRGLNYGTERGELPAEIAELVREQHAPRRLHSRKSTPQMAPERRAEVERTYPPIDEVRALWGRAPSVLADGDVAAYLERRGADARAVHDGELARALPSGELPQWAAMREPWSASGHRLLVPLFDATGALRSLLARDVTGTAERKSLAPRGYTRRGLVMACGLGRQILERGARPEWWTSDAPRLRIVVVEGEIDHLVATSRLSDSAEYAPAVVGIVSGSWTAEIAARIPDGTELVIATDDDTDGEKYAAAIVDSLEHRNVRLMRGRARRRAA